MDDLLLLSEESKPGKFDVYQGVNGEKYYVLEGLDPADVHEAGLVEQFMHQHYGFFEVFYWLLFAATLFYLVGTYILLPVHKNIKIRKKYG